MTSPITAARRAAPAFAVLAALAAPGAVQAQMSADVQFQRGNFGTVLSGTITGDEYFDYRLEAGQGQRMSVELTVTDSNGSGTAYFNILPPGSSGEAIYNSSISGNATSVTLPQRGDYTIRVYHMGSDESEGRTTGYKVDLSIQ